MLDARTHGHKGDFVLCPMLCIALDSDDNLIIIWWIMSAVYWIR